MAHCVYWTSCLFNSINAHVMMNNDDKDDNSISANKKRWENDDKDDDIDFDSCCWR